MSDLIDRQEAIDVVESTDWYHISQNGEMVSGANSAEHQAWYKAEDIYKVLEELPSAQPESQWIPCSDGLPERCKHYIVTDFGSVEEAYYTSDGHWFSIDGNKLKDVTAWMQLPEPYQEGGREDADEVL